MSAAELDPAVRVVDCIGREWARKRNGSWGCIGGNGTADSFADLAEIYGPVEVTR